MFWQEMPSLLDDWPSCPEYSYYSDNDDYCDELPLMIPTTDRVAPTTLFSTMIKIAVSNDYPLVNFVTVSATEILLIL